MTNLIPMVADKQNLLLYSWKFLTTTRALTGYYEVTWHLTMKLFPAKISKRAKLQNLWRERITVHCYRGCWPQPPLQRGLMNFQLQNFQLSNKSLKDWSLVKRLIFFPRNPNVSQLELRFSGIKINCFSRDQSLSVYCSRSLAITTGSRGVSCE